MKTKSAHSLLENQGSSGFTLIELLAVIAIIGILAAIALPNFLSQSGKAKQTEAKQNINIITKLQRAYFLENRRFTDNLDEVGVGSINGGSTSATSYFNYLMAGRTDLNKDVHVHAYAKNSDYRSYVGETILYQEPGQEVKMMTVICEGNDPNQTVVHASTSVAPVGSTYHTAPIICLDSKEIQ